MNIEDEELLDLSPEEILDLAETLTTTPWSEAASATSRQPPYNSADRALRPRRSQEELPRTA